MKSSKSKLSATSRFTYHVLQAPIITEKSTSATALRRYTFQIHPEATKHDVALAVESFFKVQVESVAVSNRKPKSRRFRGRQGMTSAVRKAVVKLKSGSIDLGGKV